MNEEEPDGATLRETVRKRADVLASLRSDPADKPALVDRLPVSRSTVDRAVEALVDGGLIERTGNKYRLTPAGRLALDTHQSYVDLTDRLAEAAPILDAVPPEAELDRSLLTTGTVQRAEPHAPESALAEPVVALREADHPLSFSPVAKSNYFELVYEGLVERNMRTDLILDQGASESLRSLAAVTPAVEELMQADQFSVSRTDVSLPFTLFVVAGGETEAAGIVVHDDGGIVGSVLSRDEEAVAWARDRFNSVWEEAEPLPPSALDF